MTSELSFKKEFEDVIINQNFKEALNSLIPNSKEYIYLQFCEEYNKCISNKKISKELNSIIKKSGSISSELSKIFKIKKILLEYDLSSTSKKRKNQIIDELCKKYCRNSFDFNAPYFVKEKMKQRNEMEIEDEDDDINSEEILELTDDIIKNKMEELIQNKLEQSYSYYFYDHLSYNKKIEIILEYIKDKNKNEKALELIKRRNVPFFLMKKDEFTEVVNFLNAIKEKIGAFYNMTYEQIERLLNELNNPLYISKDRLLCIYINKKYNKLIKYAGENLGNLKNILMEICDIFSKYSPKRGSKLLIYILKINKMMDIIDIKPLIEYFIRSNNEFNLKEEKDDDDSDDSDDDDDYYKDLLDIPNIFIEKKEIKQFIEDLILDFFIHDKAKIENFKDYMDKTVLERLYYISRLLRGEETLSPIDDKYITYGQYCALAQKKEITICEHNAKEFKINEDIKIDLEIKNIKNINISIYEINTENYFLETKEELKGLIEIEGLISPQTIRIKSNTKR